MEIRATAAVVPWSGALARGPSASPRSSGSHHGPGGELPVLEGEFIAGPDPDGRSDAERALHAEWIRLRSATGAAQGPSGASGATGPAHGRGHARGAHDAIAACARTAHAGTLADGGLVDLYA